MKATQRRTSSAVLGTLAIVAGLLLIPREAAQATAGDGSSALTVAGTGAFAAVQVTVSQTKNLANQVVTVSWKGAAQSLPVNQLGVGANFMQVMQCWGDDVAGPSPEQCQFGEGFPRLPAESLDIRNAVRSVTPADPIERDRGVTAEQFVPFRGADGSTVKGDGVSLSAAFTVSSSNEIAMARTRGDGSGNVAFEVQTGLESSALGCGFLPKGTDSPRGCWLVVVPRGRTEVDGTVVTGLSESRLHSSPLSASNWQNRIAVPLSFNAISAQCPIGKDERPVSGNETIVAAMAPWQSGFCRAGGSNLSFVREGDGQSRASLGGDSPQLKLVSGYGAPPAADAAAVYAPVALTAVTLGLLVERKSVGVGGSAEGQVIAPIKLNQRLVAKMLTQSYGGYTWDAAAVAGDPVDPSHDPEFIRLNPSFATTNVIIASPLVGSGSSDVARQLWQWVVQDPDAKTFLAGKPDQWGARLNRHYANETFPQDTFPRADTSCVDVLKYFADQPARCSLERAPYAADMTSAARQVFRGQLQGHNIWDENGTPKRYLSDGSQAIGSRSMSALTDLPSAARFGLVSAELRNAAGNFVAPTQDSIAAAAGAMVPGAVPGTLVVDQAHQPAGAYPLAVYAYAATTPGKLTTADAKTYADFIRYVATSGQHVGYGPSDLPVGYEPLPPAEVTKAQAAADLVAANKGAPATQTPATQTPGTQTPASRTVSPPQGSPFPPVGAPLPQPVVTTSAASATGVASSSASSSPVVGNGHSAGAPSLSPTATAESPSLRVAVITPRQQLGAGRFGLVLALILGGVALLLRGALPWVGRPQPL